ncbi:hypothetical protein EJ063_19770 [Vibrio aquaticus]|uniref:Uncharacterized protein n=1 Tax=Vibrio aquaticus TaxID=2496559 RepID=A0A3S0MG20_9VIBR|nr:hypothetical protein EJ063_19770 [Vibrio aquaticus]
MTKPRRKSGLCCIWSIDSVAFAVAAGMPVQSVRLPVPYLNDKASTKVGALLYLRPIPSKFSLSQHLSSSYFKS